MSDFRPSYRGVWVNPYPSSDGSRDRRVRAEFESETDAGWWWYGIPGGSRSAFRLENLKGEEIVIRGLADKDDRLSHTEAVLASVDAAERKEREEAIEASGLAKGDVVRVVGQIRLRDPGTPRGEIESSARILGFVKDPTAWPVCIYWTARDDPKRKLRAWCEFDDVEKVEEES